MRETKFYNNVSIFNILTESKKVISAYARNAELIKSLLTSGSCDTFPIYSDLFRKRFYAVIQKEEMRSSAAKLLSILFNFNDPSHPVNQTILSYLRDDDLLVTTNICN